MTVTDFRHQNNHEFLYKNSGLVSAKTIGTDYNFKHQVVWKNAVGFFLLHVFGLWGLAASIFGDVKGSTIILAFVFDHCTGEGVTIGAHRLYAHKTFKAHPILKGILIILHTMTGQNSMFIWCRDHRLHHQYSDTDADPHNSKRGFFFSHMGWLMTKKHPLVIELGRKIDMSDLEVDWMIQYQKKYYYPLYILLGVLFPVWTTVWLLGETWANAILVVYFFRYIYQLNGTWLVNSAAHLYGTRPYDQNMPPAESWFVSLLTLGEGWHNYHHSFPWDYKAAELSMHFNFSATLIRWFEKIGLASDLKSASPEMVKYRILKKGDGTHYEYGFEENRAAVTAFGPVHPLNPTYTAVYNAPNVNHKPKGLPLYHEQDLFGQESNIRQ